METFPQQTNSHNSHDDQWYVVSAGKQLPLCIACLVEHLEDHSVTVVQRQFNLSLLASVLAESDELPQLLREHPLVCQHIMDILTDHYTDHSSMTISVQICVELMDTLQSEELYVYLLDKFYNQVQNGTNTVSYVVATLGKLSVISSAYVLTLILTHEHLLLCLLEAYAQNCILQDDVSESSLPFLLIRLFDVNILPVVPPQVLHLVEQCLINWMTTAQSVDLQVNTLALLKRVLSADCCLWNDDNRWMALLLGFKRMFISKKEVLVTAATQCLIMIASNPKHARFLQVVLEGDLSEFLFESLHTLNVAQLEAVLMCLYLFAEHDLFFTKCHAVYGLESVLRYLDMALDSQNITILTKGFCVLSNILQRQPSTIPLFVNKNSLELMMSVLTKGAQCHAIQVVLPALTAATALLKDPKVGEQPMEFVETIVEAALTTVGSIVWRGEAASVLSSLQVTEDQLLDTLLVLLTAVVTSTDEKATMLSTRVLEVCNNIISYFSDHFSTCTSNTLLNLFHLLNTLYKSHKTSMQDLSRTAMSSGLIVQVLMKQSNFSSNLELLTSASNFVCHMFHVLLMDDVPQCQSLPDYLKSGLRQLSFRSSIQETVDDIREEDTAVTLCMIFYFSCLNDSEIFSAAHILYALKEFQAKQILNCTSRPLVSRFLLYLLAWTSAELDKQMDCSDIESVEKAVVQHSSELPVELWATPCSEVFLWLFHNSQRANGLGASLLEHWLLHNKGSVPAAGKEPPQPHVICTLFLNHHFRAVLMNLITSTSEEISVLARKLSVRLIMMEVGEDDQQNMQLVSCVHDEVTSLFQQLFLNSFKPSRHIVNNFLQVTTALLQHSKHDPVETDHNKQVKLIYHVVHYISAVDSKDCEILYNGMAFLQRLSKTTDEEQDRTVVPILIQNTNFIQQLERCLHNGEQRLSTMALSLAAWISSSCSDCSVQYPISISAEFILKTITTRACEHVEAALKILYMSLVSSGSGVTTLLSFHRSESFLQSGPLFTTHDLRLLFCHVQQYICLENKEIQFSAVQCLLKLVEHSLEVDRTLGEHFLHHPWNPHLLHAVLSQSVSSGLELHVIHLVKQIWYQEDDGMHAETARLVLESILATEISKENKDTLHSIFQKAKVLCQDKDLVERATSRLDSLENSLSFSQNTLTSC